ncbi:hypothetical protein [Pseudogracilibacillus sp. SO30301A]|uniref:hypothetical protein n=1 Tax=Pseudogracilibacillus sp. SO30301A TaxID=3098291 RepID=UPI00300E45B4
MVNNYNIFNTSIGRVTIEPTLEHATSYGGIFPLPEVATALILGRVLGIERGVN